MSDYEVRLQAVAIALNATERALDRGIPQTYGEMEDLAIRIANFVLYAKFEETV